MIQRNSWVLTGCNHIRIRVVAESTLKPEKKILIRVPPLLSFIPAVSHSLSRCFMTTYFIGGTEECCYRGCCFYLNQNHWNFMLWDLLPILLGVGIEEEKGEWRLENSETAVLLLFRKWKLRQGQVSWPKSRASWSVEDYVIVNFPSGLLLEFLPSF